MSTGVIPSSGNFDSGQYSDYRWGDHAGEEYLPCHGAASLAAGHKRHHAVIETTQEKRHGQENERGRLTQTFQQIVYETTGSC